MDLTVHMFTQPSRTMKATLPHAPTPKPSSADELLEEAREKFEGLSKQLRIIARYLEANRELIGLDGIQDFAGKCGVQPSAVIRFAKHFGFSGFSEMQALFRDEVAQKLGSRPDYQERIRSLVNKSPRTPGVEQIRAEVVRASIDGLHALQAHGDPLVDFESAVKLMASAHSIWLVASRRSFPVGAYLSYALQQTGKPTHWLHGLGYMQLGEMRAMSKSDVLVAVSFSPYAQETLEVVKKALSQGVRVIAITDSKFSPIAKNADATLIAHDGAPYGFRTLTSTLCLAQSLFISLAYTMETAPQNDGTLSPSQ